MPGPPREVYNRLPSLDVADNLFIDRSILGKLYGTLGGSKQFAIALIHRHTQLEQGEIMVVRGDNTQPEQVNTIHSPYFPMILREF